MTPAHRYHGPLSTSSKTLLLLWPIVAIPMSLLIVLSVSAANSLVWPAPLEPIPQLHAAFAGAFGIGTSLASLAAYFTNRWDAARPQMFFFLGYALVAEIAAIRQLLQGPVPLQIWGYIVLGLVFIGLASLSLRQGR
jgi:hypothetical protein